ncbi:PACE efflux transporter [Rhodobacter sp. SY28-1]|uniref:PACE efflux transporter n=1 Tax=Rhodobacter sp. SY28-1 TaxID=2562317 RepID=UPI0010BFF6FC|nr:PACE efflux transporter [Rhodobacter sp. SY28-1]
MSLRSPRERLIQTLAYEAGGLCLSVPLVALFGGGTTGEAFTLMLALSVAVMIWSPIHNTLFDWADLRLSGRLASDRPQGWRLVHAASHEATTVIVTLPILIWLGGMGFWAALLADLGLTLLYAAYAYVFHLIYDRLRPVRSPAKGLAND